MSDENAGAESAPVDPPVASAAEPIVIENSPASPTEPAANIATTDLIPEIPEPSIAEASPVLPPAPNIPASQPQPTVSSVTPDPAPQPASTPPPINDLLPVRGLAAKRARIEIKLLKILAFAATREWITNDDVEKLLHISNATATRYLNILVKRGALQRTGVKSHARYSLVK